MPPKRALSDYQVQVLLERVLRRPLWRVQRDGPRYHVRTTAFEEPIAVLWQDLVESLRSGNLRPTPALSKTLLLFQGTGVPDKDGNDVTGRVSPPPRKSGITGIFRSLFGGNSAARNGAPGDRPV